MWLIHLQKSKLMLPLVLILLMFQDSTMNQPKQKWLGIRSITVASSKHGFHRGMSFRAVHPPRNSKGKTTPIKNRPHSCEVDPFAKKENWCCHLYFYNWCARLHHVPIKTEMTWNQKHHNCFIKRTSISIATMVFKRGCPWELFTPQEPVREKPPQ